MIIYFLEIILRKYSVEKIWNRHQSLYFDISLILKFLFTILECSLKSNHTLEELVLSRNIGLCKLPDWIDGMTSLKKLKVSGCSLTDLPERYVHHITLFKNRTLNKLQTSFTTLTKPNFLRKTLPSGVGASWNILKRSGFPQWAYLFNTRRKFKN